MAELAWRLDAHYCNHPPPKSEIAATPRAPLVRSAGGDATPVRFPGRWAAAKLGDGSWSLPGDGSRTASCGDRRAAPVDRSQIASPLQWFDSGVVVGPIKTGRRLRRCPGGDPRRVGRGFWLRPLLFKDADKSCQAEPPAVAKTTRCHSSLHQLQCVEQCQVSISHYWRRRIGCSRCFCSLFLQHRMLSLFISSEKMSGINYFSASIIAFSSLLWHPYTIVGHQFLSINHCRLLLSIGSCSIPQSTRSCRLDLDPLLILLHPPDLATIATATSEAARVER
ncbi:uncharacterized protein LOC119320592 [Triticum dicoccoides]|uniref:uncharacterized protein LOC119320592 n=1 Tax=Triticum dicoccoides TaxID=85692 RepID=UPI0018915F34|nr:uncharacterized protein LOC119320592 [Triticum dicoccoides]